MITATCHPCNITWVSRIFGGITDGNMAVFGNTESCPQCGRPAPIEDGVFNFEDGVLTALSSPSVTRPNVIKFQQVIEKAKEGQIDKATAAQEVEKLGSIYATIWQWVGENDKQLMVLLTIIGLFLAHYHFRDASDDAQADLEVRQSAVRADQMNAQATARNAQALEKIGAELQRMNADLPEWAREAQATKHNQRERQAQTNGPKNRHERLKERSLSRKAASRKNRQGD